MSPATKKLLEEYAAQASWSVAGHSRDIDRFWGFVIAAYKNSDRTIPLDEFLETLHGGRRDSMSDFLHDKNIAQKKKDLAAKIFMFNKYEDGMRLLRKFEEAR